MILNSKEYEGFRQPKCKCHECGHTKPVIGWQFRGLLKIEGDQITGRRLDVWLCKQCALRVSMGILRDALICYSPDSNAEKIHDSYVAIQHGNNPKDFSVYLSRALRECNRNT